MFFLVCLCSLRLTFYWRDHKSADAALSAQIMSSTTLLEQCDLVLSFNGKLANKSVSDGPAFARLEVFANTPVAEAQLGRLIVR